MGLTGVIYGVIVVLWLCYLVPLALRRHDEAARSRSVDRFSSAMRVLGRGDREPLVARRRLAMPASAVAPDPAPAPGPTAAVSRRAAGAAAARRRRVLVVLLFGTLVVTALAVLGLLGWWAVGIPVLLVGGFLVVARTQVSRARTAAWERSLRATAARAPVPPLGDEPDEAPTVAFEAVRREASGFASPLAKPAPAPSNSTGDARVSGGSPAEALAPEPPVGGTEPALWDPLPVTLPTYVTKPRAARAYRTVDLAGPGAWTSGHLPLDAPDAPGTGSEPRPTGAGAVAPRAVGD